MIPDLFFTSDVVLLIFTIHIIIVYGLSTFNRNKLLVMEPRVSGQIVERRFAECHFAECISPNVILPMCFWPTCQKVEILNVEMRFADMPF